MQEHDLAAVRRLANQHHVGRVFTPEVMPEPRGGGRGGEGGVHRGYELDKVTAGPQLLHELSSVISQGAIQPLLPLRGQRIRGCCTTTGQGCGAWVWGLASCDMVDL
jgi:hypothetical protein